MGLNSVNVSPTILSKSEGIVALRYIFLFSRYRAGFVTAFASNLHFLRSSLPARVAAVFFAGLHHTVAWDMRTGALLRVFHQLRSKLL